MLIGTKSDWETTVELPAAGCSFGPICVAESRGKWLDDFILGGGNRFSRDEQDTVAVFSQERQQEPDWMGGGPRS